VRPLLPPDLKLDLIADQPSVVRERIQDLEREFLLAIGSVIIVTIILLPIRVAVIAATAIPVTVAGTLGMLNAAGIRFIRSRLRV
jgi:multidrug efflux pump subunit AcrB